MVSSISLTLSQFSRSSAQGPTAPYNNRSLPIQKRVDDLVARMTLEEKVSQMMNGAAAINRLDIPEYGWWNEGLQGVARAGFATVFSQAIGLAATLNLGLMHRVADVISTEAQPDGMRAHKNLGIMNPTMVGKRNQWKTNTIEFRNDGLPRAPLATCPEGAGRNFCR
jgi:beta-glucosidase-like glycosyl hydrolase